MVSLKDAVNSRELKVPIDCTLIYNSKFLTLWAISEFFK